MARRALSYQRILAFLMQIRSTCEERGIYIEREPKTKRRDAVIYNAHQSRDLSHRAYDRAWMSSKSSRIYSRFVFCQQAWREGQNKRALGSKGHNCIAATLRICVRGRNSCFENSIKLDSLGEGEEEENKDGRKRNLVPWQLLPKSEEKQLSPPQSQKCRLHTSDKGQQTKQDLGIRSKVTSDSVHFTTRSMLPFFPPSFVLVFI